MIPPYLNRLIYIVKSMLKVYFFLFKNEIVQLEIYEFEKLELKFIIFQVMKLNEGFGKKYLNKMVKILELAF